MIDEILDKLYFDGISKENIPLATGNQSNKVLKEALTAIYEIGLECIGADEPMEVDADNTHSLAELVDTRLPIRFRNDLRASQRKAWAKACGVAEE